MSCEIQLSLNRKVTIPWKPEYSGSRPVSPRPSKQLYPRNTIQPARGKVAWRAVEKPDATRCTLASRGTRSVALSGLEPGTSCFRVERSAATSPDPTDMNVRLTMQHDGYGDKHDKRRLHTSSRFLHNSEQGMRLFASSTKTVWTDIVTNNSSFADP
ncbi:hypothetical protein Bbelb_100260 [Branchiostoma belcheri]|nr:hypothetical protein Bbelb_100260 [Branchiostoma belcheri]